MSIPFFCALLSAGTLLVSATAAQANTVVITEGWMMRNSAEQCAKYAKKVAFKAGFAKGHEYLKSDDRLNHSVYAYTSVGPYAMAVNCNEKTGVASLAVSGVIAEKTSIMYDKVVAAYRKIQ